MGAQIAAKNNLANTRAGWGFQMSLPSE